MHVYDALVAFRGYERLLIQFGALQCILLGTLMYRWGVRGKVDAELGAGNFAFKLTNAAPGSILALFGMTVMIAGLAHPLRIDPKQSDGSDPSPGSRGDGRTASHSRTSEGKAVEIVYAGSCAKPELALLTGMQQLVPEPAAEALSTLTKWTKYAEGIQLYGIQEIVCELRHAQAVHSNADAQKLLTRLHEKALAVSCSER